MPHPGTGLKTRRYIDGAHFNLFFRQRFVFGAVLGRRRGVVELFEICDLGADGVGVRGAGNQLEIGL